MSTTTESPFDPNNAVVQLCAQGMELEGKGEDEAAAALFLQAWNEPQRILRNLRPLILLPAIKKV